MRVLLVEDNTSLASALLKALTSAGHDLIHALEGKNAVYLCRTHPPEVVVLDLGLPDMDGLEVLAQIKKNAPTLPVLILTARDSLEDKVRGLTSGADDYLPKPFEMPELLARLAVIERRMHAGADHVLSVGGITLNLTTRSLYYQDKELECSRREFDLLKVLLSQAGKVVTRSTLEEKLYSWGEDVSSNALEVHIHNLRKKIGKESIKTVRGVGYSVPKAPEPKRG